MEPLIITATPNVSWLNPNVEYPRTAAQMATEARLCEEAGAAILHIHAQEWVDTIDAVRNETSLIVQCGMSSLPIPERMEVFSHGSDMISIIVSHHDEAFVEGDTHALHPREELEEYALLSASFGVKLEYEVWHAGSIWNLRYLIERDLIVPPHFTSLFFGWPGGTWSPPTAEEYRRRRDLLPPNCVATVSVMGPDRRAIMAAAIAEGDHIRVGTEDHPFDLTGAPAATNELVAEAAALASALGRHLASPAEARMIVGLPQAHPTTKGSRSGQGPRETGTTG